MTPGVLIPRLLFPAHHDVWVNDASIGDENRTLSNNTTQFYQANHVSPDHLNSASQLALWIAIFIYFFVVMCISCAGRKNHTSDVEYCLVKKKVMQHIEAHEYHDCHVISSHYSHLTCDGVTKSCSYLKKLLKRNDDGRLKTSVSDPTPPGNRNINANVEALECAICLSAYQIGETVALSKLKNGCIHVFHYDCILEWGINGHSLCPVCRAPFWSNDRKNVALCREDSPEERMQCTALLYQLLVRRHHPVEQSASNDIIVEVHIDRAAAQPNESIESMSTTESAGKRDHREHNVEQSQFCVIHGLIASTD